MPFIIIKPLAFCLLISASMFTHAGTISKQQAASSAQQAHAGRVLSIKLKQSTYQVKILNLQGQVRIIHVDANTGKIR